MLSCHISFHALHILLKITSSILQVVNDPVMGGVSTSTFNVTNDRLAWEGTVMNVPSLSAPGFCKIMTTGAHLFPDVSSYTHLTATVLCYEAYNGFKIDFATIKHPNFSFGSYKADFPSDFGTKFCNGAWTSVAIPFLNFTNDWSGYTGEPIHTCSEDPKFCPTTEDLATITQLSFWAEGVGGNFKVDIKEIGAASF